MQVYAKLQMRTEEKDMSYNIAVIPGDGIGPEIVREAQKVLDAAGKKYGFELKYRTGNDPRADIMHFDRMLPFFKKDPGISNTTGERFCLFSINKNMPSPAVWNRQLQNLIFGYADPALDTVCTLFYICHRFFSPLFCLFFDKTFGNTINLHLFQLISM